MSDWATIAAAHEERLARGACSCAGWSRPCDVAVLLASLTASQNREATLRQQLDTQMRLRREEGAWKHRALAAEGTAAHWIGEAAERREAMRVLREQRDDAQHVATLRAAQIVLLHQHITRLTEEEHPEDCPLCGPGEDPPELTQGQPRRTVWPKPDARPASMLRRVDFDTEPEHAGRPVHTIELINPDKGLQGGT